MKKITLFILGWIAILIVVAGILLIPAAQACDDFLGLKVAPENRCSEYKRSQYHYPASIEHRIVERQGGRIWSPYTDREFSSIKETDIEHIVAAAEAHDSGLCARPIEDRKKFARDLENLTLASPRVNRWQKSDKDAAEWLPDHHRCWYVQTIVSVKRKWKLSVDQAEADALRAVLEGCD
ncbi:MAG: HNH endonuclease [Gammaproteobacteria bacterium]|nr:HNH endonuclease [Gammaproteobacteria bacterium]MYG67112.1 HNH endonuclease [Gammaproteobacteria bacterium]